MLQSDCSKVVRVPLVVCLLALGCAPVLLDARTKPAPLPTMRTEPAPALSPPGLPAVIVAELAAPDREARFARNGVHGLLATRAGGQWVVGPVRIDGDAEGALSTSATRGGMQPIQAASENTTAALHRHANGFLLAWVEQASANDVRVMALALGPEGKPLGPARVAGRSTQAIDWVDVLGEGGATFIVWDAKRGAKRTVELAAWGKDGPSDVLTLEGGRGWHAVAGTDALWFASVSEGLEPGGSVSLARVVSVDGKLAVDHHVISRAPSAMGDVQLAALQTGAVVAWSDRRDGDLHVYTSSVAASGAASTPRPFDSLGAQALVGITASGDRTRAMLASEHLSNHAAPRRIVDLGTLLPDGSKGEPRGELVFQSPTDTPQVFGDGTGFGVLTLAPVRLASEPDTLAAAAGPTFVRLDGDLRLRSSEPLRIAEFSDAEPIPGLPMFVQSPECSADLCTVVARSGASPSLLALVTAPLRNLGWSPAARRVPPVEPPLAEGLMTVVEFDHAIADFSVAELADGRTVLASVERVPAAAITEKTGGRLQLRFIEKDGTVSEPITLSDKAIPVGGVDIEALPAGGDAVAAVAWSGPAQGGQVFVTRVGPHGEKLLQKTVTKLVRRRPAPRKNGPAVSGEPNEVRDVDLTLDGTGGLFCTWSDTRTGNAEIFVARINAQLDRLGRELQLTSGKGASSEPQLLVLGDKTLLAWSETGEAREQGDIHLTTLETASLRVIDRGRELAHSAGHSRSPGFSKAPGGAALWWLDEPPTARAPAEAPEDSATGAALDDAPGLRVLALDPNGQPLAQVKRLALGGEAPNSMALRCETGACKGLLVSVDGGELRLDAVTTPFTGAGPLSRTRVVGLSEATREDVRVMLTDQARRAFFVEEREGRTRIRKLTLRWSE